MMLYLAGVTGADGDEFAGLFTTREKADQAAAYKFASNESYYTAYTINLDVDSPLPDVKIGTKHKAIVRDWRGHVPHITTRKVLERDGVRSGSTNHNLPSYICFSVWTLDGPEHLQQLIDEYIKANKYD